MSNYTMQCRKCHVHTDYSSKTDLCDACELNLLRSSITIAMDALRAAVDGIADFIRCAELAELPGYIVTKDTWECGECSPMDGSGVCKTREEVKHEPDCYQGACERLMKLRDDIAATIANAAIKKIEEAK
jgi:hypothetical protein